MKSRHCEAVPRPVSGLAWRCSRELPGVWDWHIHTGLVYADENTARLYAIDPKAAQMGVSHLLFRRMLHPDDISILTDAVTECILTGKEYKVEYRVRRVDGSYDWLSSTGRCVYDEQGHAYRVTGLKYHVPKLRMAVQRRSSTAQNLSPGEQWKTVPGNIQALLEGTIYAIASKPEEITLEVVPGVESAQLILRLASVDVGKVLGKEGKTIQSIRTLLRAVNGGSPLRYSLDIEALG